MIDVSRIDNAEELLGLSKEWNKLLESCSHRNIFMTFEWIYSWWKHFGKGRNLYVLVASEEGQIKGIAPLMVSKIKNVGIRARKIEFIGMPLSDYSDFIIDYRDIKKGDEILQAFCDFLKSNKKDWDLINLNRIQEGSPTLKIFRSIRKPSRLSGGFSCDFAPRLVRGPSSIKDNKQRVHKELRQDNKDPEKSMGRSVKRFLRDGKGKLTSCNNNKEGCSEKIELIFSQHIKRWEGTPTTSMFNDENHREFFIEVMDLLMPKGLADIIYLPFNEKPAAFLLVFMYNDVFCDYMSTSDSSLSRYSPGRVLLKLSMDSEISSRYGVYDFMRGNHRYKLKYASQILRLNKIIIHQNPVLFLLDLVSSRMEFIVKQNEWLYEFFLRFEKRLRVF